MVYQKSYLSFVTVFSLKGAEQQDYSIRQERYPDTSMDQFSDWRRITQCWSNVKQSAALLSEHHNFFEKSPLSSITFLNYTLLFPALARNASKMFSTPIMPTRLARKCGTSDELI